MTPKAGATFDAFLSFARKGHPELARLIRRTLEAEGRRVFIDESIDEGDLTSDEIIEALSTSMILIAVFYSRQFPDRYACQWELRQVFLEAEGDPTRRIIIVNPEQDEEHIAPPERRDARYVAADGPPTCPASSARCASGSPRCPAPSRPSKAPGPRAGHRAGSPEHTVSSAVTAMSGVALDTASGRPPSWATYVPGCTSRRDLLDGPPDVSLIFG
jgi:hypothetical protein